MFEFNSERKCMSVIVKDYNLIKLYVKGADNVIFKKIKNWKLTIFIESWRKNVTICEIRTQNIMHCHANNK